MAVVGSVVVEWRPKQIFKNIPFDFVVLPLMQLAQIGVLVV